MIADYHRWSDEEAKQLVYAYMKGTALEFIMDIHLTGPEMIGQVLDEYQNRFLQESDSQLLRAEFACVVQLPNESVQKLHARMQVLYHLAYPDANTRNEVYLIEKFISALNNFEVQNYVRCRKPPMYAKALHIANEETSFILMDLATHAPGGLQAPMPRDTSVIAVLKAQRAEPGRGPALDASITTATRKVTSRNDVLPDSRISSSSALTGGTAERPVPRPPLATGPAELLPQQRERNR